MKQETQTPLLCGCGLATFGPGGLCVRCHRRARLSRERFGGLRELVLRRDRYECQGCGSIEGLLVHHRRPGRSSVTVLLTLCRRCHAKVHTFRRPPASLSPFLLLLWREVHPRWPENRRLAFVAGSAGPPAEKQTGLFDAGA